MTENATFYVYALYYADGVTPCYIGKGKGDRWKSHEQNKKHYNLQLRELLALNGGKLSKAKLKENLSEIDAYFWEHHFIMTIGRICYGGPLMNLTEGGEGCANPTPEVREKMAAGRRGKPQSEEAKRKNGDAHRGMKRPPGTGQKIGDALRGRKKGPLSAAAKAHISRINKGKIVSAETGAKISAAKTGKKRAPFSEEHCRKTSATMKGVPKSEAHRLAAAEGRRKMLKAKNEARDFWFQYA